MLKSKETEATITIMVVGLLLYCVKNGFRNIKTVILKSLATFLPGNPTKFLIWNIRTPLFVPILPNQNCKFSNLLEDTDNVTFLSIDDVAPLIITGIITKNQQEPDYEEQCSTK